MADWAGRKLVTRMTENLVSFQNKLSDCKAKLKGGGIAVLVNNRWCNPQQVTVEERLYTQDAELLAVSFHPWCPLRVHLLMLHVICDTVSSVLTRIQTQNNSSFMVISGEFNHISLSASLPTSQQFVDKCSFLSCLIILKLSCKKIYIHLALNKVSFN